MERSSVMMRNLIPAQGSTPSEQAAQREMSVVLADVLVDLEPDDREVVILRNLQELAWDEIAERMQRSRDAVHALDSGAAPHRAAAQEEMA